MIQNKTIWTFSFRLWWVIALCLAWVFLVRDSELFSDLTSLSRSILFAGVIALFAWFYRDVRFECVVEKRDLVWFVALVAALSLVNGHVLLQALACDELYHLGMASQSVIAIEKIIHHGGPLAAYIRNRPMTELVALLNVTVLACTALIGWCCVQIISRFSTDERRTRARFILLFVVLIAVGQLFRSFPSRIEIHPPLRLLPLFLAQLFFGYDDVVFRMVSTVMLAGLGVLGVNYVRTHASAGRETSRRRVLLGIAGFTVPTILHVSSIVEPSIWVYGTWLGAFVLLSRFFSSKDERYLIATGVLIALGSLARQNGMVLWAVLGLVLLWKRPKASTWVKSLLPCLWFLPFFAHLVFGNHPAKSDHPIQNVVDATTSAKSFFFIAMQTTPPWIFSAVVLVGLFVAYKLWRKEPATVVWLAAIPAFILYFSINPFLWPLGRYQAEWISPIITVLLLTIASRVPERPLNALAGMSVVVMLYSLYTVRELHRDSYYDSWPERRITSESMYPYRQAFGHLEQAPEGGSFTFTFGVPVYGEWLLYLRGYSFNDVEMYRSLQNQWQGMVETSGSWQDLVAKARGAHIRYQVVQYGNRREMQHRAGWQNDAERMMRIAAATPNSGVMRLDTYSGDLEGKIDVYGF